MVCSTAWDSRACRSCTCELIEVDKTNASLLAAYAALFYPALAGASGRLKQILAPCSLS